MRNHLKGVIERSTHMTDTEERDYTVWSLWHIRAAMITSCNETRILNFLFSIFVLNITLCFRIVCKKHHSHLENEFPRPVYQHSGEKSLIS